MSRIGLIALAASLVLGACQGEPEEGQKSAGTESKEKAVKTVVDAPPVTPGEGQGGAVAGAQAEPAAGAGEGDEPAAGGAGEPSGAGGEAAAEAAAAAVPEEPRYYDPTPAESVAVAVTGAVEGPAAPRQVVPFPAGIDPFASLAGPASAVLDSKDPRSDTVRLGPKAPPEPGEISAPFPPPVVPEGEPPVVVPPLLRVVRYAPEGEVALVDSVTATFNHPMVPLATLGTLAQAESPLVLEPAAPGEFVWLGSDTVAFRPTGRLPFATRYQARVAAGVTSALGGRLAEALEWTISTPRPKLVGSVPYDGSNSLKPDFSVVLEFNARIEPQKVMAHTKLKDLAGNEYPLVLVGRPEPTEPAVTAVEKDEAARRRERMMEVRPASPLPLGTQFLLEIGDKLTCEEGPLPADLKHFVRLATYYPLKIERINCTWSGGDCYPGSPVYIEFNNPLKKQELAQRVTVIPPVEGLRIRVEERLIQLFGEFLPSESYDISVSFGVEDIFGQKNLEGANGKVKYQPAWPLLTLARTGNVVVEARESHELMISAMNLETGQLKLAYVPDEALAKAAAVAQEYYYQWDAEPTKGFQQMVDRELKLIDQPNRLKRTAINLDEALERAPSGHGLVLVDLKSRRSRGLLKGWDEFRQVALVQVTDLGVTAALHRDSIKVLVSSLSKGEPVAGAMVQLVRAGSGQLLAEMKTGEGGEASLPGPGRFPGTDGPYLLVARKGSDRSFLHLQGNVEAGSYQSSYYYQGYAPEPYMAGVVYSERGLYRPAEEIQFSVIARVRGRGPDSDLTLLPESQRQLYWSVRDPRWNEVASGQLTLSPFGTGSFTITTDKNCPLGDYSVSVSGSSGALSSSFQVQEYRTPEYKVAASWLHHDQNILVGRTLEAVVSGEYFFGAPMNGADVEWSLVRQNSSYSPPDNPGFNFQDVDPQPTTRWDWYEDLGQEFVISGSGKLDGQGQLRIPLQLDPGGRRRQPLSFTLEAEVYDQNRQSIAGRATILAHRAERCLGLALDRTVAAAGESVELSAVVTRLDGSRYDEAQVKARLMVTYWDEDEEVGSDGRSNYVPRYHEEEVGGCELTAGQVAGKCLVTLPKAGSYVLRAESRDLAGRPVRSATRLWAYGEGMEHWAESSQNRIELVPDRPSYRPGEEATLLIQSPFARSVGMLVIAREGVAEVRPLKLDSPAQVVRLPIKEQWLPSVEVGVVLVRGRSEPPGQTYDDRGRPAFAHGIRRLDIDRDARAVTVRITPSAAAVSPGEELDVALEAVAADGTPLVANLAVMVVDEGVLSLISYLTPDPLSALYQGLAGDVGFVDLRPLVLARVKPRVEFEQAREETEEGAKMDEAKAGPGFGGALTRGAQAEAAAPMMMAMPTEAAAAKEVPEEGEAPAGPTFALREFFRSTAFFDGAVVTGSDGKARVRVKMPDNLTQFRIMAVAADGGSRFGSADSQVRTRRPLVVRPALPRFLNFGDRFEAAAVVNNQTGFDTEVLVRCQSADAVIEGEPVRRVAVPHGGAVEVRFAAAAGKPGPATFQFAAVALTKERHTDAAQLIVPTLLPTTSEAFATYGVTDGAVRQPIVPPADVVPGYGGLDVALSSTALTGLQDAVSYLFDYPYECTEQICSRILPIIALKDVIVDFKLGKADSGDKAATLVKEGLERLGLHQRPDGGFGYWPGSRESWLYVTTYAVMTMMAAREAGYEVAEARLQQALDFLSHRLDYLYEWEKWDYGAQALAALLLARADRPPRGHLERLYELASTAPDRENPMTLYARAWLLEALVREGDSGRQKWVDYLRRELVNAGVETAGALHFSEGRSESLRLMMHSEDRTDAIVLSTLVRTAPEDPAIEKVVRGLVRARVHGRWSTTQANAFALLALSEYYRLFEKETPDFLATLWHGGKAVVHEPFKGREMKIVKSRVPMATLLQESARELILAKQGPGRLYYRLGLQYAPAKLDLKQLDRGFLVERLYLPENRDGELRRNEDGSWVAKAGTYVRVKLRVVAPDRRFYVAVVDPLPAGFEAVNEAFATSATQRLGEADTTIEASSRRYWWYSWNPWDYEERRDDRVQLFADRMYDGVYEYTYVVRATTIGTFVVPPTRAEEMYEPETFGRSASDRMIVEP